MTAHENVVEVPAVCGKEAALQFESMRKRIAREGLSSEAVTALAVIAPMFPGVFTVVYCEDGCPVWVSDSFKTLVGVDPSCAASQTSGGPHTPEWCNERRGLLERAVRDGQPRATVEIFHGCRVEGAMLPLPRASPLPIVVFIGRFGMAIAPQGVQAWPLLSLEAELLEEAEWGRLSVLTRCQLEVLRLIASVLDNAEIASAIHRTKRAVEFHIKNLYQLLGCTQRTELFRLGLQAGLQDIDDAHWDRMMGKLRRVGQHAVVRTDAVHEVEGPGVESFQLE